MASPSQPGELVFEHRRGRIALLIGFCAIIVGPVLAVNGLDQAVRIGGAVGTFVGFILICVGLYLRGHVLRVYERGLEDKHRFVHFDDVQMVQAEIVTLITSMGTGTNYDLIFEGQDAAGPFRIAFRSGNLGSKFKRAFDLLKAAGEPVARRMKNCLEDAGQVAWTDGLVLRSSSVYVEASGIEIPYSELEEVRLDNGYLHVRAANGYRKKMKTSNRNFYPGFWLLMDQVNQRKGRRL